MSLNLVPFRTPIPPYLTPIPPDSYPLTPIPRFSALFTLRVYHKDNLNGIACGGIKIFQMFLFHQSFNLFAPTPILD